MGLLEWNLAAAIVAGFGYLLIRNQRRAHQRQAQARAIGLDYVGRGLTHVPSELMSSVLFLVADGGHEREVMTGVRQLGTDEVTLTQFDLSFQRDVRGEWAFLATKPPFRLVGPTTVLAYELPRDLPRVLIKRRGPAELIADELLEVVKSGASVAREVLGIDRTYSVPAPEALGREPLADSPLDADYLIWASATDAARGLLQPQLVTLLQSSAMGGHELIIETAGPLVLVYCATDAELSLADGIAVINFSDALCKTLLALTNAP